MRKIKITAGGVSATAMLDDNETADAIWEALPIVQRGNRWGDEIYFSIPVEAPQAGDAREVMEAGELAYWPPGSAFCIFWGPTPASRGGEIRAASPVNPCGWLEGDAAAFDTVPSGAEVKLVRAQPWVDSNPRAGATSAVPSGCGRNKSDPAGVQNGSRGGWPGPTPSRRRLAHIRTGRPR